MNTLSTFLATIVRRPSQATTVGRPSQAVNKLLSALLIFLALNNCASLTAGFYLTGAQIYEANEIGLSSNSYRYTTNIHDITLGAFSLGIEAGTRQDHEISFELITGVNNFAFNTTQSGSLFSDYLGINLFFNDTGTSFNPPNISGNLVPGHLTAFVNINSGAFSIVGEGTEIQNYDFRSGFKASAGGSNTFTIGEYTVSLTSLSATTDRVQPRGAFGLTVTRLQITAVPEPTTLGLSALGCVSVIGIARRRLWRKA